MEELKNRFVEAVHSAIPGAEFEIDPPQNDQDVDLSGIIAGEGFGDRDQFERQTALRRAP